VSTCLLLLLQTSQDVADVYAELQAIQDEEMVGRVQHGVSHAIEVSDVQNDTMSEQAGTQEEQLVDLFAFLLITLLEREAYHSFSALLQSFCALQETHNLLLKW
jgi:hypothetical protein